MALESIVKGIERNIGPRNYIFNLDIRYLASWGVTKRCKCFVSLAVCLHATEETTTRNGHQARTSCPKALRK